LRKGKEKTGACSPLIYPLISAVEQEEREKKEGGKGENYLRMLNQV